MGIIETILAILMSLVYILFLSGTVAAFLIGIFKFASFMITEDEIDKSYNTMYGMDMKEELIGILAEKSKL